MNNTDREHGHHHRKSVGGSARISARHLGRGSSGLKPHLGGHLGFPEGTPVACHHLGRAVQPGHWSGLSTLSLIRMSAILGLRTSLPALPGHPAPQRSLDRCFSARPSSRGRRVMIPTPHTHPGAIQDTLPAPGHPAPASPPVSSPGTHILEGH